MLMLYADGMYARMLTFAICLHLLGCESLGRLSQYRVHFYDFTLNSSMTLLGFS